jgi:hypothetical protein
VNELAGMARPSDISKLVLDAIQVLFYKPLEVPSKVKNFVLAKKNIKFV